VSKTLKKKMIGKVWEGSSRRIRDTSFRENPPPRKLGAPSGSNRMFSKWFNMGGGGGEGDGRNGWTGTNSKGKAIGIQTHNTRDLTRVFTRGRKSRKIKGGKGGRLTYDLDTSSREK